MRHVETREPVPSISRGHDRQSLSIRTGLATVLLSASLTSAGQSQTPPPVPAVSPETQPKPPPEIMPAPLPPGARADTPGGTTSNGVARPPSIVDPGIEQAGTCPRFILNARYPATWHTGRKPRRGAEVSRPVARRTRL